MAKGDSDFTYSSYFLYSLIKDQFLANSVLPGKSGSYLCWERLSGYAVLNLDLETSEERNERIMEFLRETEGDDWSRENFVCVFGKIEKDLRGNIITVDYDYQRSFPFYEKDYTISDQLL